MIDMPCKQNCPNRTATCHADCEKWLRYLRAKEFNRKKRNAQNTAEATIDAIKRSGYQRWYKIVQYKQKGR